LAHSVIGENALRRHLLFEEGNGYFGVPACDRFDGGVSKDMVVRASLASAEVEEEVVSISDSGP
jgi:hypothetical protein